jgi:hypothetical protein
MTSRRWRTSGRSGGPIGYSTTPTGRLLMSWAGVPADHAERALGHKMAAIRGTYDRSMAMSRAATGHLRRRSSAS